MMVAPARAIGTPRLWSLQYLRAFAAIAVVVFHQFGGRSSIIALGHHGVDMFFVLSGFLMVATTDRRVVTPRRFAFDRIARIVPLYWLATFLAYLSVTAWEPLYGASSRPDLLARSLIFIPTLNDTGKIWPTLYLGWTLNFEIFFYALFAVALMLRPAARIPMLATIMTGLAISGLVVTWNGPILQFYSSPIITEFLAGMLLAKVFGQNASSSPASIAWHGAALALVTIASMALFKLWFAPVAIGLVGGALALERRQWVPSIPWLKILGDASFSIYLFQQFAFEIAFTIFTAIVAMSPVDLHVPGLAGTVCSMAAIGLGLTIYYTFERPVTRLARARLARFERGVVAMPASVGA